MSDNPIRIVFELKRLPEKTDEALLEELRRVAALVPGQALTVGVFMEHGKVSRKLYNTRWGSWAGALAAAGLSEQSSDRMVVRGAHPSRTMSDDDVLQALRDLAVRLSLTELTTTHVQEHLPFSGYTLRSRWGTTQAAFQAAGLNTSLLGRRYTDEDCYRNMLTVWTHYGRPPKHSEMGHSPSGVGGKAYMLRFGTWNKALAAFVERVNSEPAPDADASDPPPPDPTLQARTGRAGRTAEDAREVALGLRFRVLHRDRFKCVLCGDHPARNAECRLHVDHVVPWSLGGKTREDNLRTLCEVCNVGRGNRFVD